MAQPTLLNVLRGGGWECLEVMLGLVGCPHPDTGWVPWPPSAGPLHRAFFFYPAKQELCFSVEDPDGGVGTGNDLTFRGLCHIPANPNSNSHPELPLLGVSSLCISSNCV